MNNHPSDLFQRYKRNPILTAANWPHRVNSVFNPGATLLSDGTTLLLCRVEDRSGHSHSKKNELDLDYIKQWATRLGLSSLWKEMLDNVS
jgi:predicted GH43/DUF377 family glycosyl hydrolase